MNKSLIAVALIAALAACGGSRRHAGWKTLIDGTKGLENFDRVGEAAWTAVDGAIQASSGGQTPGYLVSKVSYWDFELRVEFWASDDANSGVFLRCQDPAQPSDESCYEANIFDQRPDPTYGTGAIVKVAAVAQPMPKAGGRWNVYEITAAGDHVDLRLNGKATASARSGAHRGGPIALQWAAGAIKFRKVTLRPL